MEINVQVTKDNVCFLNDDQVHKHEVNVDTLVFSFSEDYTDDLVKIAVFTNLTGTTYRMTILNNKCVIPYEALQNRGMLVIGVYAYKEENGELQLRYSPTPLAVTVENGSYIDGQDGTILVPALTIEEYEQAIQEALTQFEIDKDAIIQEAEEEFDIYYNGKVNDFDTNATNKTNTFNNNATDKTNAYNSNATDKTNSFNSNATDKTTAFNNNANDKTADFNNNYTTKVGDFNTNATNKTTDFNNNAINKTNDFNENAEEIMQMNEMLLDQIPTGTATDTVIHLADSSNLPVENITPYGNATQNGTPAPDSPVPINVVTGDVEVNVKGKNWFDKTATASYSSSGVVKTLNANGDIVLTYTSTASGNRYQGFRILKDASKYAGKTIYFTGTWETSGSNKGILLLRNGGSAVRYGQVSGNTYSYYIPADQINTTIELDLYINYQGTLAQNDTTTFHNLILTIGDSDLTYEPYTAQTITLPLGSLELAGIGDYKDYIYKNSTDNKWYVRKNTELVTLTGAENESWTRIANDKYVMQHDSSSLFYNKVGGYGGFSNYFAFEDSYTTWTGSGKCGFNSIGTFWCMPTDETITTATLFKEWLSTHNTQVYFKLATPTDTEITDQALITALENLQKVTTYKNVTNIFTVTTGENPTLEVVYRKDLETLFGNLTSAILSLGGNI